MILISNILEIDLYKNILKIDIKAKLSGSIDRYSWNLGNHEYYKYTYMTCYIRVVQNSIFDLLYSLEYSLGTVM